MLTLAVLAALVLLAITAPRWGSDSRTLDARSSGR